MNEQRKQQIEELFRKIESIEIQGATNVAIATLEGMRLAADITPNTLEQIESVGFNLSKARDNEPLARNAVKYVLSNIKGGDLKQEVNAAIANFNKLLFDIKNKIKQNAVQALQNEDVILTHCHSSTSTGALIELAKINPRLQVVSTETRPLFQGRKTALELTENNVNTTMIVDSAVASFIIDDRYLPVGACIVGCDELLLDGRFVNKVGSYIVALAANAGGDEFYVVTTLLKIDTEYGGKTPNIEIRPGREVWENAPEKLKIINPAFELVPSELVTGYITEAGVLKKEQLASALKQVYSWV
jgi:ribose 1,5-bisphosphate isomerase